MKVTQTAGDKKAVCGRCGQTIQMPLSETTLQLKHRKAVSLSTTDANPPAQMALHQVPTRFDERQAINPELVTLLDSPEQPDEIGRLGGYRILQVIGSGGMGVVFRAHDPQLDREVALKAMLPALAASETARQRFLREARAAASLFHDHIIPIYQVGEQHGVPFLAMPFLQGESLETRIQRVDGPLPIDEIRSIARQTAEGLAAIHARGMVHRDIKPGNIFLEGKSGRVKILDFGLARQGGDVQLTQEGNIVGSPAFMAPEQARRESLDGRADLFSLGCVLYLMATGVLPFEADDVLAMLLAITTQEPVDVRKRNPALPESLARLIMDLLAKNPQDRPATAQEVIRRLGH